MEQLQFTEPYLPPNISKTFNTAISSLFIDKSEHVIEKCAILSMIYQQIQSFNISCNEQIELVIKFAENVQIRVNEGTIDQNKTLLCKQVVLDFLQYSGQVLSFEDASSLCDKFIVLSTHEERLIGGGFRYNWFNIPNTTTSMGVFIQNVRNVLVNNNLSGMFQAMITRLDEINKDFQEQDKVTRKEMQFICTTVFGVLGKSDFNSAGLAMFFAKKITGNKHSILLYRSSKRQYKILINPNVRNKDIKDNSRLKIGGEKTIKIPGVMIVVDELGYLQCVKRVVTHSGCTIISKSRDGIGAYYTIRVIKGNAIKVRHNILKQDGFEKVEFFDGIFSDPRIIYVCDYLGERPDVNLPMQEKQTIMHQLIDKFDYDKYDIKIENVLWDKQNVHYIDCHSPILTYFNGVNVKLLLKHYGSGGKVSGELQLYKQGAFELCLLFYELSAKCSEEYEIHRKLFYHKKKILKVYSKETLSKVLNNENPFKKLLIATYFGEYCNDASELESFKGAVLEVLRGYSSV